MKQNTECISDDNGVEINVSYEYEISESQIEEGHGFNEVGCLVETELKVVELIIDGIGVDVLPYLNEIQKSKIISKLTYNGE